MRQWETAMKKLPERFRDPGDEVGREETSCLNLTTLVLGLALLYLFIRFLLT